MSKDECLKEKFAHARITVLCSCSKCENKKVDI
jgi:hypothetical protein